MDINQITNSIFELDNRIRYVAILNHNYILRASRMRAGLTSLTPRQTDREFMSLSPTIMIGAAERLQPYCGPIRRLTVRYEKVVLVFYRTTAHLIVLSLEPQADSALIDKIGDAVKKLELSSLVEEGAEEKEDKH